ncbi:hypothetical protein CCR97_21650 [Rhodoplanes elegans]|uniref:MarR family transcriptional regulator n=1 Tax=Rhodoplanes elegans TaxID=29408 RepID=A0A327KG91_9BRAD|nr:hypothetical protein [Rhodoplanes elegans]MBK5960788.1 hypothetical protein [Rhodoplanes elegans]RAI37141.1 hypothetical protein CH338_16630 [Rhodoplanes elegans]
MLQRSDLVAFMPTSDMCQYLARVAHGHAATLHAWVVDGLRDHGLIDHHDRLTEHGHRMLSGAE